MRSSSGSLFWQNRFVGIKRSADVRSGLAGAACRPSLTL